MAGEMQCVVCHWWPPLVGVRKRDVTYRLTDEARWRALFDHVEDMADVEAADRVTKTSPLYEAPPGPHQVLWEQVEALGQEISAFDMPIELEE